MNGRNDAINTNERDVVVRSAPSWSTAEGNTKLRQLESQSSKSMDPIRRSGSWKMPWDTSNVTVPEPALIMDASVNTTVLDAAPSTLPDTAEASLPDAPLSSMDVPFNAITTTAPSSSAADTPVARTPSRRWSFGRQASYNSSRQDSLTRQDSAASLQRQDSSSGLRSNSIMDGQPASPVETAAAAAAAAESAMADFMQQQDSSASFSDVPAPAFEAAAAESPAVPQGMPVITPVITPTGSVSFSANPSAAAAVAPVAEAADQAAVVPAAAAVPSTPSTSKVDKDKPSSSSNKGKRGGLPLPAVLVLGIAAAAAVAGAGAVVFWLKRSGKGSPAVDAEDAKFEAELAAMEAEEKALEAEEEGAELSAEEAELAANQAEAARKEKIIAAALAEGDAEMAKIDAMGEEELGDLDADELAALEAELAELEGDGA